MKPTILCLVPHVIRPPPPQRWLPPKPTTPSSSHMFDSGAAPSEGPGPQCKHYFTKSLYLRQGLEQTKKYAKKLCASRFFWGEGKGGSFSFSFLHSTNQLCVSELPDFFVDFFLLALCHYLSSNLLAVTVFVNEQSRQTLAGWD